MMSLGELRIDMAQLSLSRSINDIKNLEMEKMVIMVIIISDSWSVVVVNERILHGKIREHTKMII